MSKTNIGWTDEGGNPFVGCRKVSDGCNHCYAIEDAYLVG
jgi:protein gp37